ncbi:hypothetical protein [Paraliomyxa miuraensis]|uniref:hypothetical protein n=1 Tax=Paraliomyxa miuraensis TaxID=376150 RepID=UPI00225168E9|nr:hypothetical protein [Paraliomyxa miuraensis]MCX4247447.1 hypothetical protein [Paraliomyxa miuraensis]
MGLLACVIVSVSTACTEPDLDHEGGPDEPAEIVVSAVEGARLCAGTQTWVDDELRRVRAETGLLPVARLPVTLGAGAVEERCTVPDDPETVVGCTLGEGGATAVISTPEALSHELVHALRRHQELRTRTMFEEGFAEAIDGSDAYPRYVELEPGELPEARWPEALVQQSKAEFRSVQSYRVAVHFVDHLRRVHGAEAVAAFMRGGIDGTAAEAETRFERHFGTSLEAEAQAWRASGAQGFGRGDPCAGGVVAIESGVTVELVVRVDCDDPETMGLEGAAEAAWIRRCVSLGAGRRAVQMGMGAGPGLGAVRWEAVPQTCAEGSSELDAAPKVVEAGDAGTLEFAACTWAVTFESTADGPQELSLTLGPG